MHMPCGRAALACGGCAHDGIGRDRTGQTREPLGVNRLREKEAFRIIVESVGRTKTSSRCCRPVYRPPYLDLGLLATDRTAATVIDGHRVLKTSVTGCRCRLPAVNPSTERRNSHPGESTSKRTGPIRTTPDCDHPFRRIPEGRLSSPIFTPLETQNPQPLIVLYKMLLSRNSALLKADPAHQVLYSTHAHSWFCRESLPPPRESPTA